MKDFYDVVVVGGGPGGVGAAIGAAKEGAAVLLVERFGFLGGTATGGLVNTFMPYKLNGRNLANPVFNEMEARLEQAGALTTDETLTPDRKSYDEQVLMLILDEMMRDYGVDVLLHSLFVDLEMQGDRISQINTYSKSGKSAIRAKVYVDSSGDGDVAAKAGATIEIGRPSDGLAQPMTPYFHVGGLPADLDIAATKKELLDIVREARANGELDEPYDGIHLHRNVGPTTYAMQCNHIVRLDATNVQDLTRAEMLGRRGVHAMVNLFRAKHPAFQDAYVLKINTHVGVRESRRIMGEYVLDAPDIIENRKFADGIAESKVAVDIHNPEGPRTPTKRVAPSPGDYYEIPYRCLVPLGIENLLIGSRCISSTHVAHGSLRMIATVMSIGEAAGRAAAWAATQDMAPRAVDGARLKARLKETS